MVNDKLAVSELMTTSLIALPPVVPVRRLVDTLRMCSHQAFPVTPEVEKALGTSGEAGPAGSSAGTRCGALRRLGAECPCCGLPTRSMTTPSHPTPSPTPTHACRGAV